jgi:hypothetical protein
MEGVLLTDPEWPEPDERAVIGMWPLRPDGSLGPFRSNPSYRPRFENSPTDPLDAVIRLFLEGEVELEQLREMLDDSVVGLALNGDGRPLLLRSPDDQLCVVVATSSPHRSRVFSPGWRDVTPDELVSMLPDEADLLVNPGGPGWVRLSGDLVR